MNVLIVGSGGREHALAWAISHSLRCSKLYVAPGNAGTAEVAENVPIKATDIPALVDFARQHDIGLTVVGPEDPLVLGIVNAFQKGGLKIFGPTAEAAMIEGSKAWAANLMFAANVPRPHSQICRVYDQALAYVCERGAPIVIKASGLAAGKGAYVCKTLEEATAALQAIMVNKVHGEAGQEVVIEECLEGEEVSVLALCDGQNFVCLPPAQDHKRLLDGDQGPNTGGMGTIAPLPQITAPDLAEIGERIIRPTLKALVHHGRPFVGCLFAGLMLTEKGPKVLEFNARFGDPEIQSVLRLLDSDLLEALLACAAGRLPQVEVKFRQQHAVTVVLASGGYPNTYGKGFPIDGLSKAKESDGVVVFHAGTTRQGDHIVTSGGRVLGVSAVGWTPQQALDRAYSAADLIHFNGQQLRRDIGARAYRR